MSEAFQKLAKFSEPTHVRKGRSLSKLGQDFKFLIHPESRFTSSPSSSSTDTALESHSVYTFAPPTSTSSTQVENNSDLSVEQGVELLSQPRMSSNSDSWSSGSVVEEDNHKPPSRKISSRFSFTKRSASDIEHEKRKKKSHKMMKQHKTTGRTKRGSALKAALMDNNSWVNAEAEVIGEAARATLPFNSMTVTLKLVDAVKIYKIFFLSIVITSFTENSKFLPVSVRALLWCSFALVIASSALMDPLLTYQYGLLTTMACLNPLLIGETVEHMSDVDFAVHHLARWIVSGHRVYIQNNLISQGEDMSCSDEVLFQLLKVVFGEWDLKGRGYIGRQSFMTGISELKLGRRQKNAMFKVLDIDLNRKVVFAEFCVRLGPHLRVAIEDYLLKEKDRVDKREKLDVRTGYFKKEEEEEEQQGDDDDDGGVGALKNKKEEKDVKEIIGEGAVDGDIEEGALKRRLDNKKNKDDVKETPEENEGKDKSEKKRGSFGQFVYSGLGINI